MTVNADESSLRSSGNKHWSFSDRLTWTPRECVHGFLWATLTSASRWNEPKYLMRGSVPDWTFWKTICLKYNTILQASNLEKSAIESLLETCTKSRITSNKIEIAVRHENKTVFESSNILFDIASFFFPFVLKCNLHFVCDLFMKHNNFPQA